MTTLASRLDRITVDPEIVHGKPRIRGTRVTVQVILELLSAGETIGDLVGEYDELACDDVLAVLEYAGRSPAVQFVVDAQLARALADRRTELGHDAMHVKEFPSAGDTPEREIARYADEKGLVVVTKDDDFRHTHLTGG